MLVYFTICGREELLEPPRCALWRNRPDKHSSNRDVVHSLNCSLTIILIESQCVASVAYNISTGRPESSIQ